MSDTYSPIPGPVPTPPSLVPPQRRKSRWLLGGIIGLTCGLALGSCTTALATSGGGDQTAALQPQPGATVTATTTATATATVTASAKPAPTKTVTKTVTVKPKPPKKKSFGDGMWKIGTEMPAGRYTTTVPADSYDCYWERDKDDSGDFGAILANDNLNPGAHASVTVKKGEFFKSAGCGTWTKK